jgi:hypothetical protein
MTVMAHHRPVPRKPRVSSVFLSDTGPTVSDRTAGLSDRAPVRGAETRTGAVSVSLLPLWAPGRSLHAFVGRA